MAVDSITQSLNRATGFRLRCEVQILERGRIVEQKTSAETDHASLRERYLGTPALTTV